MKIRQIKLDLLYEYIQQNAPVSIQHCVAYYINVCSAGENIYTSGAYKQLYVLRKKKLIDIVDRKMVKLKEK